MYLFEVKLCPSVKGEECSEPTSSCAKLDSCTNEEVEDICLNDCSHDLNAVCYEKISQSILTECSCMDLDGGIIVMEDLD